MLSLSACILSLWGWQAAALQNWSTVNLYAHTPFVHTLQAVRGACTEYEVQCITKCTHTHVLRCRQYEERVLSELDQLRGWVGGNKSVLGAGLGRDLSDRLKDLRDQLGQLPDVLGVDGGYALRTALLGACCSVVVWGRMLLRLQPTACMHAWFLGMLVCMWQRKQACMHACSSTSARTCGGLNQTPLMFRKRCTWSCKLLRSAPWPVACAPSLFTGRTRTHAPLSLHPHAMPHCPFPPPSNPPTSARPSLTLPLMYAVSVVELKPPAEVMKNLTKRFGRCFRDLYLCYQDAKQLGLNLDIVGADGQTRHLGSFPVVQLDEDISRRFWQRVKDHKSKLIDVEVQIKSGLQVLTGAW